MGKFVYAVMMVFVIELALYLFGGTYGNSSLFNLITNPSLLTSNPIYILILGAVAAFAIATIIPFTSGGVSVYVLYAGIIAIFITFGASIVHLWGFLNGTLTPLISAEMALVVKALIIGPILITYILACAEWIRSNT